MHTPSVDWGDYTHEGFDGFHIRSICTTMKYMDTEVYSWRVSRELKSDLERQARIRKTSVSAVLNLAVREWLKQSAVSVGEDEEQRRLHEAGMKCVGVIAGGNPRRAETAREATRERLKRRNAR
jgi:hypothetical protein